nr:hypothetical protein CFP56_53883 [Quercus suber]
MSKGKSVKQEKLKEAAAEESVEDVGPKSKKKKKTGKSQKQLILAEEKEVEQPLATRGRVKTKSKCKLDPRKGKSQSSGEDVKAHYPPKLASLGSFQRQNRRRWGPSPEFLT